MSIASPSGDCSRAAIVPAATTNIASPGSPARYTASSGASVRIHIRSTAASTTGGARPARGVQVASALRTGSCLGGTRGRCMIFIVRIAGRGRQRLHGVSPGAKYD
jgi:hypothetical protein